MRLRDNGVGEASRFARRVAWLAILACLLGPTVAGRAAETPAAPPPATAAVAPASDMSSAGWLERIAMRLESEAMSDVSMLPDTPAALVREWRSFDKNGSALGALINLGWIVLAAVVALCAQRAVARGLSRGLRRALRSRPGGPTLVGLFMLLVCDGLGLAVFGAVFVYSRHWLMALGATINIVLFAAHVLIRWRIAMLVVGAVLRPKEPVARLIEVTDLEAHRLARFLSATILAIVVLIDFGRYGLADEDSGAPHVISLIVAAAVASLYVLIVFRARDAAEALIRGRDRSGLIGALRAGLARAWLAIGLTSVAGLMVFFVFGLSLGLLSYYHALSETLDVLLVVIVLERLTERGWHDAEPSIGGPANAVERLMARSFHRVLRALVVFVTAMTLAWIWIDAIEMQAAAAAHALQSTAAALGTLFVAFFAWELIRLGIDRHLQNVGGGPKLPGSDDDDETAPGSRLQTILPMLRAAFGVLIAVVVTLIVLSRLGIDTAPLIAGAGVFGLAISFGAQSLVRDIISGLFYLWDDAFRVGEYIDTGRLKGTVEALGIRSVKLRHHNGPLHTIPYGQLGAVTNQSRDFATIKFNLRLEPGTDVELVRKTAKRIGLEMQEIPEIAAEVMLPLKMQGIAEVADNAVVFRFKFTARPVKPSWVQREYLKTMYRVFSEKGIAFASGALTLQTVAPRSGAMPAIEGEALPLLAEAMATPASAPVARSVA
ncbi:MAG: mechanosensitive ion channel domain-containing protein [Stellaceae bacterium]